MRGGAGVAKLEAARGVKKSVTDERVKWDPVVGASNRAKNGSFALGGDAEVI